jgi:chloride channel protein, CIC family
MSLPSWFSRIFPQTSGFEASRYLVKWLFLSTLIGTVAGFSAIAFTFAIDLVTHLSLGKIAGYLPPSPVGEGTNGVMAFGHPWLVPVITTIGGLISGIIVFTFAPEAEGHGTDAAIDSIHHKRGRIRSRIPPIKLIASAITIGSGGSGGREGPTAQMSAGFGSILSDWLGLNAQDRRIAVCVGIGSGIGAIFRAPLGGALMAAEILYIHDLEIEALIPTLMASIVGYSIYGGFYGYVPIFGDLGQLGFNRPVQLIYYAMLGLVCGLGGLLYRSCFYGTISLFHRIHIPPWVKPAIGGFLVGCIGLLIPGALHTGYGWVQLTLSNSIFNIPLWMILLLPIAKIVATSFSIGSGGSGGIFGPGMVIGGLFGASFWRLTYAVFPGMPHDPGPFVIIGMMALFGGIAHAPLAVMLMVAEMTGNLSLLAPAMLAVAIATAVVGNRTIYKSQLMNRAESPAHRVKFSFPLLSSLLVRDAMTTSDGTSVQENSLIFDPDLTLDVALDRMVSHDLNCVPVLENNQRIGVVTVRDIMQAYKTTLERSIRRTQQLAPETTMFEVKITSESPLVGRSLRQAGLPQDTMVVSITHEGETVFPRAETKLQVGDQVLIMSSRNVEQQLRMFLSGNPRNSGS